MYRQLKKFLAGNMAADEATLDNFCGKFRLKKTRRNEILLSAGDVCPHIYEPTEVLYINHHDFRRMLDTFPGWERVYRISLEKDYIASIKRIESLITMDATQRYRQLMETDPALIRRLPSRIIADYLGVSQETLSRLKAKK